MGHNSISQEYNYGTGKIFDEHYRAIKSEAGLGKSERLRFTDAKGLYLSQKRSTGWLPKVLRSRNTHPSERAQKRSDAATEIKNALSRQFGHHVQKRIFQRLALSNAKELTVNDLDRIHLEVARVKAKMESIRSAESARFLTGVNLLDRLDPETQTTQYRNAAKILIDEFLPNDAPRQTNIASDDRDAVMKWRDSIDNLTPQELKQLRADIQKGYTTMVGSSGAAQVTDPSMGTFNYWQLDHDAIALHDRDYNIADWETMAENQGRIAKPKNTDSFYDVPFLKEMRNVVNNAAKSKNRQQAAKQNANTPIRSADVGAPQQPVKSPSFRALVEQAASAPANQPVEKDAPLQIAPFERYDPLDDDSIDHEIRQAAQWLRAGVNQLEDDLYLLSERLIKNIGSTSEKGLETALLGLGNVKEQINALNAGGLKKHAAELEKAAKELGSLGERDFPAKLDQMAQQIRVLAAQIEQGSVAAPRQPVIPEPRQQMVNTPPSDSTKGASGETSVHEQWTESALGNISDLFLDLEKLKSYAKPQQEQAAQSTMDEPKKQERAIQKTIDELSNAAKRIEHFDPKGDADKHTVALWQFAQATSKAAATIRQLQPSVDGLAAVKLKASEQLLQQMGNSALAETAPALASKEFNHYYRALIRPMVTAAKEQEKAVAELQKLLFKGSKNVVRDHKNLTATGARNGLVAARKCLQESISLLQDGRYHRAINPEVLGNIIHKADTAIQNLEHAKRQRLSGVDPAVIGQHIEALIEHRTKLSQMRAFVEAAQQKHSTIANKADDVHLGSVTGPQRIAYRQQLNKLQRHSSQAAAELTNVRSRQALNRADKAFKQFDQKMGDSMEQLLGTRESKSYKVLQEMMEKTLEEIRPNEGGPLNVNDLQVTHNKYKDLRRLMLDKHNELKAEASKKNTRAPAPLDFAALDQAYIQFRQAVTDRISQLRAVRPLYSAQENFSQTMQSLLAQADSNTVSLKELSGSIVKARHSAAMLKNQLRDVSYRLSTAPNRGPQSESAVERSLYQVICTLRDLENLQARVDAMRVESSLPNDHVTTPAATPVSANSLKLADELDHRQPIATPDIVGHKSLLAPAEAQNYVNYQPVGHTPKTVRTFGKTYSEPARRTALAAYNSVADAIKFCGDNSDRSILNVVSTSTSMDYAFQVTIGVATDPKQTKEHIAKFLAAHFGESIAQQAMEKAFVSNRLNAGAANVTVKDFKTALLTASAIKMRGHAPEKKLRRADIFQDQKKLEVFRLHMANEFSAENIDFLIEADQFVKAMDIYDGSGRVDPAKLDQPASANDKRYIQRIYDSYISQSGDQNVNLSSAQKLNFDQANAQSFDNMSKYEMLQILFDAQNEILKLCDDPLMRFGQLANQHPHK